MYYGKQIICLGIVVLMVALAGCIQTPSENGESTDDSLSNVLKKGILTVGSDVPYPPMEFFNESGEIVGLDIDIIKEIAYRLGVSCDIIDYEWEDIFDAAQSGEIDIIISSITITPDRSDEVLFSVPYFDCGQVIIVNASNDNITIPQNLSGKKVGAQKNTTSINEAFKYTDASLVFSYNNYTEYEDKGIIYDLKNGTLDAIIVDYVVAAGIVDDHPSLKIVGEWITQEYFGMATKKGNNALIDEINDIIRDMLDDGTIDQIKAQYGCTS